MIPVLFKIGPFTVHSFGLMVALGFLFGMFSMRFLSKRGFAGGISEDLISSLVVSILFGGALGARIAHVAENWEAEFKGRFFEEFFRFDKGGLMFYGGLIGAIAVICLFAYIKNVNLFDILDLCGIALPLGHAFGRIGCFLNGCCFGRISDSAIAICYPPRAPAWTSQLQEGLITISAPKSLPVLPSQLIEASLNLILFVFLFFMALKKKPPRGLIAGCYLVGYSIIRFFTETLRSDPRMQIGPLSIAQTISIVLLIAGICFIIFAKYEKGKTENAQ